MRLEEYFRGLSDPTRLRVLNLLFRSELCGCDLQWLLAIPQPLVSRHLVYLKRCGLVADRRDGFRVFYRPAEGKVLKDLFGFLHSAFLGEEIFARDAARLGKILADGKLPSRAARAQARHGRWKSGTRPQGAEAGRRRVAPA
jgi:ArsR family transcriptional regulator, arsenate/arsenite/antimonite-responsive transcriptional repressor